jgi:hypothetical protein
MKIDQLKSVHAWVRSADTSEILFVSALIMPFYVLLYDTAFTRMEAEWKNIGTALAVVFYVAGVIWMKVSQSANERNAKDLTTIRNHVVDKGYEFMSFERIQNDVDQKYTEERVRDLVFAFPNEIRMAKLKEGKRGIKVLNVESE